MLTLLRDLRRLDETSHFRRPRAAAASPSGTSTPARATAANTSSLASSPYYDLQRFGLGIVASPRHADVLLVTGPVTSRMREPLLVAYNAMPEPRRVAALGNCALGCNVLGTKDNVVGSVEAVLAVDLRIPGCPPTPAAIAEALLQLIDESPS